MPFSLTILLATAFSTARYAIYQQSCGAAEHFSCRPIVACIIKHMGDRNPNVKRRIFVHVRFRLFVSTSQKYNVCS